jgi:hypothetical protein
MYLSWQTESPENCSESQTLPLCQVPEEKPKTSEDPGSVVLPDLLETEGAGGEYRHRLAGTLRGMTMQLITVKVEKPDAINFILGQTHFIKSVDDIHEALVGAKKRND